MRESTRLLFNVGDLAAPVGSPDWCAAVALRIRALLDDHKSNTGCLSSFLDRFIDAKGWAQMTAPGDYPGQTFASFRDFILAKPPFGLGRTVAEIARLLGPERRTAADLAADPEVQPAAAHGANQYTTQNGSGSGCAMSTSRDRPEIGKKAGGGGKTRGTASAETIVRRLKRDHPQIARDLADGKYPSARAAGIAAGFVQKAPCPVESLCRAWRRASTRERASFVQQVPGELLDVLDDLGLLPGISQRSAHRGPWEGGPGGGPPPATAEQGRPPVAREVPGADSPVRVKKPIAGAGLSPPGPGQRCYTTLDLVGKYETTRQSVHAWYREGRIPPPRHRKGRALLWDVEEVDEHLAGLGARGRQKQKEEE